MTRRLTNTQAPPQDLNMWVGTFEIAGHKFICSKPDWPRPPPHVTNIRQYNSYRRILGIKAAYL